MVYMVSIAYSKDTMSTSVSGMESIEKFKKDFDPKIKNIRKPPKLKCEGILEREETCEFTKKDKMKKKKKKNFSFTGQKR